MQAVPPAACVRLAPAGVPARPALRPALLARPRLVSRAASGQEPAQWEKAAAADAELQSRISEAVDVAETEARNRNARAFRERFKSAAAADLRPRPPPPLPLATPPPSGPTSAPGGWRPAPRTPQAPPELPTRTLRAATNAALLLLPVTAAAAAAAAAAASRPAAALRTLLLVVTGAAGLALSLALVTMSLAAAALLAHAAWRLFLGAPRAASPRAAAAADAVSDGAEETVRRFMRTRRDPPPAPAAAAAPPAAALSLSLSPVDLEELLRRLVSALRWSALPFLGLSVLAAAATAPQALERAAAALFAASFGVASSLALLAAAMAGSAALVSRAAGSLRQLLAPDDTPQLRLPQLWQPALAQPLEDEALPYAPAALPAPWTPAAEQEPGGEEQQRLDVPAPAERSLPRFRARSDEPASLEEMRARAKEVYWANKNWKETLANPPPTQKRASRPRAAAPMSADEAAYESRRNARAAWAQRVKQAQARPGADGQAQGGE